MSALRELHDGSPGGAFAAALYRCTAAVARARRFPPPDGFDKWTAEAVVETAHDWLSSDRAPRQLSEIALLAVDDDDLLRLLQQRILNYFRDQGRATAKGALVRRLRELLDADPRFAVVPRRTPGAGNYALAEDEAALAGSVYGGRDSDLVNAAWRTPGVRIIRWRPDARREGPLADAASLAAVCESVLRTAEGSMRLPDLAEIVADRFGLRTMPAVVALEDVDVPATATPAAQAGSPSAIDDAARAVVDQLSARERAVLAHLGHPVRAIADRTGLSKSTAATHAQRVTDALRALLADDPDAEAIAARAQQLASAAISDPPG